MIILLPKKVNTNISNILEIYKNTLDFHSLTCPFCSSNNFIKWGSYQRNAYFIDNNQLIFTVIDIKRVKCKDCNKTHALIPSFIVPYRQHCLDFIIYSIANDPITFDYNISFDTISKWKSTFNRFLPYLKTLFNSLNFNFIISSIKDNIFVTYHKFYAINKKILMMIHSGILNTAYF